MYVAIIIIFRAYLKGKIITREKDSAIGKLNILSFGVNKYADVDGEQPTIHAEHDAILKLPSLKKKKNNESINILVLRFSKTSKLGMSKPCIKCIEKMQTIPHKKGYKIENVYYSDNDGNIVKTTLSKLINEDVQHYSRYYKKNKQIKY